MAKYSKVSHPISIGQNVKWKMKNGNQKKENEGGSQKQSVKKPFVHVTRTTPKPLIKNTEGRTKSTTT